MADTTQKLVGRHKRLAFMEIEEGKFVRMTGFTSLGESKSSKEYSRQYVDESTERTDVVGYATGIGYEFDRYTNNEVHNKISDISDNETVGTDAQVKILSADLFGEGATDTTAPARLRTYSVIPDSSGDSTDALTYGGNFKAASEITIGTATTADGWQTCTFEKTGTESTNQ
ncbi:MAG: hypothetical protein U0L05_01420 [Schaedlerella sp.]|nr:hypothetical protein [Schaedlerella sp.]